jgi:multidrug efflux pump
MRIWLDPAKLAGYQMTPLDVRNAIMRENVELPAGSIEGNTTELTIRTLGLMTTPQEFNNLILKQSGDQLIRVRDIGRAELSPEDLRGIMKMNNIPMIAVLLFPSLVPIISKLLMTFTKAGIHQKEIYPTMWN